MADEAAQSAERAQRRAEALLAQARRLSEATERQAAAAEKTADEITKMNEPRGSRLSILREHDEMYVLRNNSTTSSFQCEYVRNREAFCRLEDLEDTFVLAPGEGRLFFAGGAFGRPLPTQLVLDEVGSDEPINVPMPPRQ